MAIAAEALSGLLGGPAVVVKNEKSSGESRFLWTAFTLVLPALFSFIFGLWADFCSSLHHSGLAPQSLHVSR